MRGPRALRPLVAKPYVRVLVCVPRSERDWTPSSEHDGAEPVLAGPPLAETRRFLLALSCLLGETGWAWPLKSVAPAPRPVSSPVISSPWVLLHAECPPRSRIPPAHWTPEDRTHHFHPSLEASDMQDLGRGQKPPRSTPSSASPPPTQVRVHASTPAVHCLLRPAFLPRSPAASSMLLSSG